MTDLLAPLINGMQHMAVGPPVNAVQLKRVCLPGSSQAGGCPPLRRTAQRRFPQPRRRNAPPRRRRNQTAPRATSTTNLLAPLINGMQHMAAGPTGNATEAKRVCLPGSSRSSQAGGCPPLRGTAQRCFPQPPRRKAPPRSHLQMAKQWRRRRNITPRAMRASARAHATDVGHRAAGGTQGNSLGPWRAYLLRHGVRPRRDCPPKDDVEPMEVDPPEHGVGPAAVNPSDDSVEPMEVDPPQ
ncbi:hypothetical protein GRJ2_003180700 [Grus japonensis]|uniref:Uncharacterized protein n=1 Tax=Grus japonensis TaxID=30415 RepID=A0ABC9WC17_GRUJA